MRQSLKDTILSFIECKIEERKKKDQKKEEIIKKEKKENAASQKFIEVFYEKHKKEFDDNGFCYGSHSFDNEHPLYACYIALWKRDNFFTEESVKNGILDRFYGQLLLRMKFILKLF